MLGIKNNSFMLSFIINNFFSYLPVYVGQALQKVKIHLFFLPITFCLNTKFLAKYFEMIFTFIF